MSKIRMVLNETKGKRGLLLLALPGILFLFVFNYLPMSGVFIAFKNINYSKGIFGSNWVGFDNFKFFFSSGDFFRITRNTLLLNLSFIAVVLIISIIFSLILFELSRKAVKIYQTALFVPYLLSWVIISYVVYIFLNNDYGVINNILKSLGHEPVNWYFEPLYWPGILMLCYLWKWSGYYTIIYYTGLMGIDSTYYEAASIDGASKLQQIFKITIPQLKPLMVTLLLLQIGRIFFADFGMFYFLTQDNSMLYPTTDVIDTFVYRTMRVVGDPGMSAAVALYQSAVGFALVIVANAVVRKLDSEKALF